MSDHVRREEKMRPTLCIHKIHLPWEAKHDVLYIYKMLRFVYKTQHICNIKVILEDLPNYDLDDCLQVAIGTYRQSSYRYNRFTNKVMLPLEPQDALKSKSDFTIQSENTAGRNALQREVYNIYYTLRFGENFVFCTTFIAMAINRFHESGFIPLP